MQYHKLTSAIAAACLLSSGGALAAGLGLSQIATTESVATAGVAGVTNSHDSSAVITNAAGLSGIDDSSMVLGVQYLDVFSRFERADNKASTDSEGKMLIPHLSYAKRINDKWVTGLSLHSPGGLGVAYTNGVSGGPLSMVKENKITMLNLTASASYQVSERLSLGAGLIAQYAAMEALVMQSTTEGETVSPAFSLSALYKAEEGLDIGVNYQHGAGHDIDLEGPLADSAEINWPSSLEFGIGKQITPATRLMANIGWQSWSDYDDDYRDTWSAGVAAQHQAGSWLLHTGFSIDTSPLDAEHRDTVLPLDRQWRIGMGAEKQLSSGASVGLAYQYQNLGDGVIESDGFEPLRPEGSYSSNRVHFLTLSYRY